jgi:Spy/CpxP family protein refolding chaperone
MKTPLAAIALSLAAVVTLAGFRCGRPDHHDPTQVASFVTERLGDLLDDLDATAVQRTQIMAIKDRLLASAQTVRSQREADRALLLAEWKSEKPDRAKIQALVDQRAVQLTALAHEGADALIEVHGVLTPEQRAKLTKKMEKHLKH